MDIVRERPARRLRVPFLPILAVALIAGSGLAIYALRSSGSALPVVDRGTLILDRARIVQLDRTVRAAGTLVARDIRVVSSIEDGTVTAIAVRAGTRVAPDSVVATLRNEALEAALADARAKVLAAKAERESALAAIGSAQLERETEVAKAVANERQLDVQAATNGALYAQGYIGALPYKLTKIQAEEARREVDLAKRKTPTGAADDRARLAIADAGVSGAQADLAALQARADALVLRAGMSGVVQSVAVESGQRIASGTLVARIGSERDLKAVVQVPESQVRDVLAGAAASVDGPGGTMHGRVAHIDPASQNGTVAVDIALDGALPSGARPDVNVDSAIFVERLGRVLSIARPVNTIDDSTVDLFKLAADGHTAVRTRVRLGRGPLDRIAVVAGLAPGDTVIVSDMTAYDGRASVRIP